MVTGMYLGGFFGSMEKFDSRQMNPNHFIKIENRFTDQKDCTDGKKKECAKWGKVAIRNFNNDNSCMCMDMESGV